MHLTRQMRSTKVWQRTSHSGVQLITSLGALLCHTAQSVQGPGVFLALCIAEEGIHAAAAALQALAHLHNESEYVCQP